MIHLFMNTYENKFHFMLSCDPTKLDVEHFHFRRHYFFFSKMSIKPFIKRTLPVSRRLIVDSVAPQTHEPVS